VAPCLLQEKQSRQTWSRDGAVTGYPINMHEGKPVSMSGSIAILLLVAMGVAGCSDMATRQSEGQRRAAYVAAAGAPVKNFRFFNLYSWEPLGEGQLAVYTRSNEAWLLDLGGRCLDLDFANSIGLTSNLNQVTVGFDKVLTGRGHYPCTITGIRPVDVKRLKLEQEAQRRIEAQPRQPSPEG
jgi:hypothetical protein